MLEEAGKDATEAFEDIGHSDEARAQLDKMLLGPFSGAVSLTLSLRTAPHLSTSPALLTWVHGGVSPRKESCHGVA